MQALTGRCHQTKSDYEGVHCSPVFSLSAVTIHFSGPLTGFNNLSTFPNNETLVSWWYPFASFQLPFSASVFSSPFPHYGDGKWGVILTRVAGKVGRHQLACDRHVLYRWFQIPQLSLTLRCLPSRYAQPLPPQLTQEEDSPSGLWEWAAPESSASFILSKNNVRREQRADRIYWSCWGSQQSLSDHTIAPPSLPIEV